MNLPWNMYSLEMDNDGQKIGDFFHDKGYNLSRVNPLQDVSETLEEHNEKGVARERIERLVADVVSSDSRVLALMSHGGQHHFTYGLCKLADKISKKYGYIHIDNHQDDGSQFYQSNDGIYLKHSINGGANADYSVLECGYFTNQICLFTNVNQINPRDRQRIIIGNETCVGHNRDREYQRRFLEKVGNPHVNLNKSLAGLEKDLAELPDEVYVTIDLDVLKPDEVRTAFTRGVMSMAELIHIVNAICNSKTVIGASILGYTERNEPLCIYSDDSLSNRLLGRAPFKPIPTFEQSMAVYSALMDAFTRGGSNGRA